MQHRPSQPFPGAAQLPRVQQSPILSNSQQSQQQYAIPGVFSPQGGLQSPFQGNTSQYQPPQQQQQQQQQQNHHLPAEHAYYSSNPSPRSTHSTNYHSKDKSDIMAATTTMQRPYPSIYHTPQSNSPASVTSPQSHDQGRAMFSAPSQLSQSMYTYPGYSSIGQIQPSMYGGHHAASHITPQPLLSYPPNSASLQQLSTQANIQSSPQMREENARHFSQTPQSQSALLQQQRQSVSTTPSNQNLSVSQNPAPPSTSNAAPGPIPATTPLVVRQDGNGVQWIAFEYSRDRIKLEYTIRCDVESVDHNTLTQEFKGENCVYPRACVPKEQYKGNRLSYETECNQVGWALAELNPCLRGKRGLIQRAVDSWRNSNRDPRLRSRRVRRQAKLQTRSRTGTQSSQTAASAATMPTTLDSSSPLGPPASRPGDAVPISLLAQQQHRHHGPSDTHPGGQDPLAGSAYSNPNIIHRPGSASQHLGGSADLRHSHTFPGYQTYPNAPANMGSVMAPPLHGSIHHYGRSGGNGTMSAESSDTKDLVDVTYFGETPERKKRKFILVEDSQKNARVRVKVNLDQVELSEIPDSYRKQNSIFPRAFMPEHLQAATQSTSGNRYVQDDVEEMDDGPPIAARVTVSCGLPFGEGAVEVSRLSRGKRESEQKINELGYRMAWGQSRVFSGRPLFLGRALDAYRNKQQTALAVADPVETDVPRHLQTRPGKRAWTERLQSYQGMQMPSTNIAK